MAVSEGVAEDTHRLTGLPLEWLPVIRNPVVSPMMEEKARVPVDHPWRAGAIPPVMPGAGRLIRQKDFETLIRAFAALRKNQHCRRVILGGGRELRKLENLAAGLELAGDVALIGHL